jgi:hypothetical protein
VEIILQRGLEAHPQARPRIISDNGPQFIARDFKEFVSVRRSTGGGTPGGCERLGGYDNYERRTEDIEDRCAGPSADAGGAAGGIVGRIRTQRDQRDEICEAGGGQLRDIYELAT